MNKKKINEFQIQKTQSLNKYETPELSYDSVLPC